MRIYLLISLIFLSMACMAMDPQLDHQKVGLETSNSADEVSFTVEDLADAEALFAAIQREITLRNGQESSYDDLTTLIPNMLRSALLAHKKSLAKIFSSGWKNRRLTTLHLASWGNGCDINVVEVLIHTLKGDDLQNFLDQTDRHGYNALTFAAIDGHTEIAYTLLCASERPDIMLLQKKDAQRDLWPTPTAKACFYCNYGTLGFLSEAQQEFYDGGREGLKQFLSNYSLTKKDMNKNCCNLF